MADSPIGSLAAVEQIYDADLFVLEQNGEAMKLSGAKLTDFIDRQVMDITVHELSTTATPTAVYDRITGKLDLGIPKGNGIRSISVNANDQIVYLFDDGTSVAVERIKGDTGMSAYQYAVSQGYTGSETDFATLQINLYEASLNEDERVQAEAERESNYAYMMNRVEQKISQMDQLITGVDCTISGTTLILNSLDVSVVDTTLML